MECSRESREGDFPATPEDRSFGRTFIQHFCYAEGCVVFPTLDQGLISIHFFTPTQVSGGFLLDCISLRMDMGYFLHFSAVPRQELS